MADRTAPRAAWLAVAVGLLLLGDWSAPTNGTAVSRTVTIAALPLVLPVARLALAGSRAVFVALVGGLLAGPVRSIIYDPLRDPDCSGCFEGAFGSFADIGSARVLAIVGAAIVAAGLGASARRRDPASMLLAVVAVTGLLGVTGLPGPSPLVMARIAVLCAAVAIAGGLAGRWWSRRRLERLVAGLQAAPDATGLAAAERDAARRPWIAPEVRLGLEQARLRIDLDRHTDELAQSRRRIVERADEEARRLERDLHDGAQPLLLDLGLAVADRQDAHPSPAQEAALADTRTCIDELRAVARSAFPPVLQSAGLGPAVIALTSGRLATVDLPPGRFDPVAERTAYLVIAEVHRRASTPLTVTGRLCDGRLELAVTGPAPPLDATIHDRVAALGGTMTSDGDLTEVTLPCA
ncbi:hypothetical protein FHX52_1616 [Humibacillus xanthopallidus]|uniref:Signal transduction histidine kinase n=1 Tax=Humibacillus xanthopallidus TaxID=412689 RepID=A0A543PWM7_9MICO|nr:hypothetical protein [Humibacillus xanthopallidus]TQN48482.1 hypothetical protein FHX52_1616 [Humibacillus xanthopallidus]